MKRLYRAIRALAPRLPKFHAQCGGFKGSGAAGSGQAGAQGVAALRVQPDAMWVEVENLAAQAQADGRADVGVSQPPGGVAAGVGTGEVEVFKGAEQNAAVEVGAAVGVGVRGMAWWELAREHGEGGRMARSRTSPDWRTA
jgi:hypothetical protein